MKKLISMLLIISLLTISIGSLTFTVSAQQSEDIVLPQSIVQQAKENDALVSVGATATYEYYEMDGYAAIVSYSGSDKVLSIPSTLDGNIVVEIGEYAFADCSSLSQVTIPEGVIYVGNEAFINCKNLKKIITPQSLLYIEDFAFGYYIDANDNYAKVNGVTIKGYPCTKADMYANDNGFAFEAISPSDVQKLSENKEQSVLCEYEDPMTYCSFTPSKTGYYFVDVELGAEITVCYTSNGMNNCRENLGGRELYYFETGKQYYFLFQLPDYGYTINTLSNIKITRSDITSMTVEQNEPIYVGDEFTYVSDINCTVTLLSGSSEIFKGTPDDLFDEYALFLNSDYDSLVFSEIGVETIEVNLGDLAADLSVTVGENPVESIEIVSTNGFAYVENCLDYGWEMSYDNSFYYIEDYLLENLTLKINNTDGTSDLWNYNSSSMNYLNNAYITVTSNQEEKPWTVGGNNIFYVNYRGITASSIAEVVPSNVKSITLASSLQMKEYEYGYFDALDEDAFIYDFDRYLSENPMKLKVEYTDSTVEYIDVTASYTSCSSDGYYVALEYDTYEWGVGNNNFVTVLFKGFDIDVNLTISKNSSADLLDSFIVSSVPKYDSKYIAGFFDFSKVEITATYNSGKTQKVLLDNVTPTGLSIVNLNGLNYQLYIEENILADVTEVSVIINSQSRYVTTYVTGCTIDKFEVVSIPDNNFVSGVKANLTYNDGTKVLATFIDSCTYFGIDYALTDKNYWIPLALSKNRNDGLVIEYNFGQSFDGKYVAASEAQTAKTAAYLTGAAFAPYKTIPSVSTQQYADAIVKAAVSMQSEYYVLQLGPITFDAVQSYVEKHFAIDSSIIKNSSYYNKSSNTFSLRSIEYLIYGDNCLTVVDDTGDSFVYLFDNFESDKIYIRVEKQTNKVLYVGSTKPNTDVIMGDANGDGKLNVLDATCIQKDLAKMKVPYINLSVCDVDNSGEINILDATYIQKKIAGMLV